MIRTIQEAYKGDKIEVDLTVKCADIQLGPQLFYTFYTSINDWHEVAEAMAAKRMGW